jgi:hypothetical protein
MKILQILVFFFISVKVFSQSIEVKESNRSMSLGNNSALSVMIYGVSDDDILKGIQKKLKDLDGKTSSKKDEVFADNCIVKSLGNNTYDIYATSVAKNKEDVELNLFVNLGGAFLDSKNTNEFTYFKTMLYEFAVEETKKPILKAIEEATKLYESQNKDLKNLVERNESLNKEIKDCESTIEKNKSELKDNAKNQEDKKAELSTQQTLIESTKKKLEAIK